jgi:hypothetical protein
LVAPIDSPKAQPRGVDLRSARQISHGLEFVEHHHAPQHAAVPQHVLEGVLFAAGAVGLVLAAGKTPTVDRQRDQPQLGANRRVCRQHVDPFVEFLFAQLVVPAMGMDVEQARRGLPAFLGDQKKRRNRLGAV